MPQVVLVHTDEVVDTPVAGRTMKEHWAAVLTESGLRPAVESGPLVVVDGRFAALRPARLRELAGALGAGGVGGALQTPNGRLLAVALPHADPSDGPELLRHPGGHTWIASEQEGLTIQDPWERARAERAIVDGVLQRLVSVGVRVVDPARVWVEPGVRVAPGATLWAGCTLLGRTRVAAGATIHAGAWLRDTSVGENSVVKPHTVCEGAFIGADCSVGPAAHLRPGAVLERDVKVGNYVEVKKAHLHEGVRASHLSYLGDADIGAASNIGAGTITCNYDGFAKHRTEIGAGCFIGSNTALVAPISLGAGTIVGAGSTLTRSVASDALALERAEERVFEGKASRLRERNRRRAEAKRDG